MSTSNEKRISVKVTPYDGDDFPEATNFPQYLAEFIAENNPGFKVDVEEGLNKHVIVYGIDDVDNEVTDDVRECIEGAWEAFCAHGYKQYSGEAEREGPTAGAKGA